MCIRYGSQAASRGLRRFNHRFQALPELLDRAYRGQGQTPAGIGGAGVKLSQATTVLLEGGNFAANATAELKRRFAGVAFQLMLVRPGLEGLKRVPNQFLGRTLVVAAVQKRIAKGREWP